ncbi:glycine/sarcosine/betaine reductase component B subunit [Vagococcus carniphilus]|uniref:Glycine/sarcosine/betaine reductase component B subunit n=1 Tax=Vagococcus carniphilus TaxID=218144 RepID=A0AAW8UA15_9ENTE|nr:glycine/sarcosine/betaine reductase component B subunit [Vagococcus carniphilus]MDT2830581.1 glycine/sarcosine/betaine reductase component B subunit [Vagococcus carniphilus]MDT2835162.1 glycine/sarcosine/betaine reductase component B subunit [Vagococcus carniphilus]MDT2839880.1 glycine/sarcosine/betaine reductase component B subunit [Vagococcus carniphilus]MDT2854674.1 glycine/sarcosine/betaine reductase component B subunit [Vagococcus carniphilus]
MKLELGNIKIDKVIKGNEEKIENHTLYINEQAIIDMVLEDDRIGNCTIEIAEPGDKTRITPVKDVIEPRCKIDSKAEIFPGVIGKMGIVGEGRTHVLKGCSVMTVGKIVGFQEGIIDMSGPGAEQTPFSKLNNICLVIEPTEGLDPHIYEEAARFAGLKVASYLGKLGETVEPDEVTTYETLPLLKQIEQYPDLPKVGYVYMLQTQGLLHDTYVYGADAKHIIPTILYPTEVMDGAVLSGNCVSACDKNTTYHHLNNPVIHDLYARHGKDINFMGVIITNETVYLADKVRSSDFSAKLSEYLGLDGVIITQEGFGNPDTDLIMNCKKIEEKDIKTVIVTDEYAGRDGASQSLADADPLANAVVTGGNANEIIVLPPMAKLIGQLDYVDVIAGGFDGSLREDGSIEVELQAITGATNEIGFNKTSAKGY